MPAQAGSMDRVPPPFGARNPGVRGDDVPRRCAPQKVSLSPGFTAPSVAGSSALDQG